MKMMINQRGLKKVLFGIILLYATSAWALTLKESIEKTLANHPDIKTFLLRYKQSQKKVSALRSAYLPHIDLQAQYDVTHTYIFPQNGLFHTKDDNGWSVGGVLTQKIWDFGKTLNLIDATKKDLHIAKLSLEEAKAFLVYRVKVLYGVMVVQKEAIKVMQKDLEVKEAYYKQAKALVKQGLKTNADTTRFLSSVYAAKERLAAAKSAYEKAKTTLSLYMGEILQDNEKLQSDILYTEPLLTDIEQKVLLNNYQLKITRENIAKSSLLHKVSKESHFGSLDAVASYTHFDTLNTYDATNVGIVFHIPLYSGGKISAEAQQARIATQIAKEQEASKKLQIQEEIKALLIDIKHYNQTIQAKKAQYDAAKVTKSVLDARYKEGLATYIEILDAQATMLTAKLGLLEAYYNRWIAIAKIDYLQGKIK